MVASLCFWNGKQQVGTFNCIILKPDFSIVQFNGSAVSNVGGSL